MTSRQIFWSFALKQWREGVFAYEHMRGSNLSGARLVGKMFGDKE